MSITVIAVIPPCTEQDILSRIRASLQNRDFDMPDPVHPMGYSVRELYEMHIGETLESLMGTRYCDERWLPLQEIADMSEMLREYESTIYNIMPDHKLKEALLSSTADGFTVESVGAGALLFTLKDAKPIEPISYNWRSIPAGSWCR